MSEKVGGNLYSLPGLKERREKLQKEIERLLLPEKLNTQQTQRLDSCQIQLREVEKEIEKIGGKKSTKY